MALLKAVLFLEIFHQSNELKISNSPVDLLVKFLYKRTTGWKFKSASKLEPLYTSLFVFSYLCHHRQPLLCFFNPWCIQMYKAASCKTSLWLP
jgi:hypothetical protein